MPNHPPIINSVTSYSELGMFYVFPTVSADISLYYFRYFFLVFRYFASIIRTHLSRSLILCILVNMYTGI